MKNIVSALLISLAAAGASQAATVQNGSFEDIGAGTLNSRGWNIFTSIPNWTGAPNIEIQSDDTLAYLDAYDGEYYAELDSNKYADGIFQDIFIAPGSYRLSFFYSPRVNNTPDDDIPDDDPNNNMTFSLGAVGSSALAEGSILSAPNDDYPWAVWTEVTRDFDVLNEGTYRLSFFGEGGRKTYPCAWCGALIDDVTITTVSAVPLPAGVLLLISGFGAFAVMRRRAT